MNTLYALLWSMVDFTFTFITVKCSGWAVDWKMNISAEGNHKPVYICSVMTDWGQLKSSVKEPNMFHNYETEKITHKASDAAEYIELFGSSIRDRHA